MAPAREIQIGTYAGKARVGGLFGLDGSKVSGQSKTRSR